jgi:branched-chain amino acid transport system substrate-binding protein
MSTVLKQAGDNLTRENIMKQAASIKNLKFGMLPPDITLNSGPEDYFLIEEMQLTLFDGAR